MSAESTVAAACARLSFAIPCLECFSTISLRHWAEADIIVAGHADPDCVCVTAATGPESRALSDLILMELSRIAGISDYGEPLPVSVYEAVALWMLTPWQG